MRLPIAVPEHRDVVGTDALVVRGRKEASQGRAQAEGREVRPRDVHSLPRRRLVAIGQTDAEDAMRRESRENGLAPLEIPEHRVAEHHVAVSRLATRLRTGLGTGSCEIDEPVWLRHREGAKQNLVEQREDRGIGADAERQRNDGDAGDERRLEEGAEGQCDVSHRGQARKGSGPRDGQVPCRTVTTSKREAGAGRVSARGTANPTADHRLTIGATSNRRDHSHPPGRR